MKKRIAILTGLLMVLCFAFAACGGGDSEDLSDSKYVGQWVAQSVSVASESGDLDGGVWTVTLNGDGTGTAVSVTPEGVTEEPSEFTWSLTDDGFKTKGDLKLTFTDDGDGIKADLFGVKLHFVRVGEEGPDDGAPDIGAEYGYMGQDPFECAVWKYLATDIASQYGPDDKDGVISVPVVQIIKVDKDDDGDDAEFYGDFWVNNYVIEDDTLKCVSGGNHPGKMEVEKVGDEYKVTEFEQVLDGADFDSSAKDIFEEDYDKFMSVQSDQDAREKLRAQILSDYVKTNGLAVTKYQDEGWDPVDLAL